VLKSSYVCISLFPVCTNSNKNYKHTHTKVLETTASNFNPAACLQEQRKETTEEVNEENWEKERDKERER
jgi:hypothetical protein